MEGLNVKATMLISLTFLVGMMLVILPLPQWLVWYRPAWVFMILLFWIITVPHQVGIVVAFTVGLLLDLLTGTILGQHAFVLTLLAYFFVRFQAQIRSLPAWQQLIVVFVSTLSYLAIQYWIMAISGFSLSTGKYWLPIITTPLLWPWIRSLLDDYQRRFELS